MNKTSRTLAATGLGAAAIVIALATAAPAGAHTGSLFTYVSPEAADGYFATISQTDATLTPLSSTIPGGALVDGIEIYNETGYALFEIEDDVAAIGTWDHNTGAILGAVPLTAPVNVTIDSIHGLDTTPDGTLLAIADLTVIEGEFPVEETAVVSIAPATGAIEILVVVTDASDFFDSLSTDPTTGITYLWVDEDDGLPEYIIVDIVAGTYEPVVGLPQVQVDLGDGYMTGADFDTSGTLWFYYSGELASLTGAPSATVGAVSSGSVDGDIADINLAYDPYVAPAPEPQLAATGTPVVGIAAGALALLGAGALVLVASRRRSA